MPVRRKSRTADDRGKRRAEPKADKSPLPESEPETESEEQDIDESGKPLSRETKDLLQLFSNLRGGPDIVRYFNSLPKEERRSLLQIVRTEMMARKRGTALSPVTKPIFIRILESHIDLPSGLRMELLKRYFAPGSSSPEKNMQWMETVLRVPFGLFASKITAEDLMGSQQVLDSAIHGHQDAKHKIITYMAQLLRNQDSTGLILGLRSYPGVGKTNLVDSGVSRILKRPFYSSSLGGVHDSSFLRGFQYTYEGSEIGYMARCLIHANIMNPVFFFDELDKISHTAHGDEIVNTLIQITDPIQSKVFQDRYLGSIATLDLSRCIFVFAYNDRALLNPILRDRITEIELQGFSAPDKLIISRDYMIPRILKDIGFPEEQRPTITDRAITEIIDRYTNEAGVRHLKQVLHEILMELNLRLLVEQPEDSLIEEQDVDRLVRTCKPVSIERTTNSRILGRVNGLFVDTGGCSGILPLEATWVPSSKRSSYEMRYTGNLGKVMGESVRVAWSVAWNLLDLHKQDEWIQRWQPTTVSSGLAGRASGHSSIADEPVTTARSLPAVFDLSSRPPSEASIPSTGIARGCLHVHCRDNAIPKDGPSAGVALTVLMWSMLTDIPLPQEIAYTGEIGLHGTLLPIGGLPEKLVGAYRAGCSIVVIPQANIDHLPEVPSSMRVIPFTTIQDVISLILTQLSSS